MNGLSPETCKWLERQVLVFAVNEDVKGPFSPEANGDLYIANSAPVFRKAILEGIKRRKYSFPWTMLMNSPGGLRPRPI